VAEPLRGSLHLFFTRAIPDFGADFELIFFDATPEPSAAQEPIPREELEYATTLLSANEDIAPLARAVSTWWQELAGAEACLELLSEQPAAMSHDEQARLARHEGQPGWSINRAFVAYRAKCAASRAEAVRFLVELSLGAS